MGDIVLDEYVGQTIRIRAKFAQITYADIRLGVTERMVLRDLVNDETDDAIEDYRSIPYDKHAKECGAEPGDTVVFTADIKAGKSGSQPSITRARSFARL